MTYLQNLLGFGTRDKWTRSDAVNKTFVAELKHKTVEAHATIPLRYMDADKLRHAARVAIEIFQDLKFIIDRQGGEDNHTRLEQAMEECRRLTIYGFASGKEVDNEVRETTAKT
ncbi:hypothetical protein VTP01DRAFT_2383 [Rhizomucor pusillus]|uniref:uncharacterized protein n=1 Tax=Rhizomucor pusillus TaxID=4840 RepID=UPI003743DD62